MSRYLEVVTVMGRTLFLSTAHIHSVWELSPEEVQLQHPGLDKGQCVACIGLGDEEIRTLQRAQDIVAEIDAQAVTLTVPFAVPAVVGSD